MKTKLTLSIDHDLVEFARQHAERNRKSVSGLFSDFLAQHQAVAVSRTVPSVDQMVGSLKRYSIDDSKAAIRSAYAHKHLN